MELEGMPGLDLPIEDIVKDLDAEKAKEEEVEYWDKKIGLQGTGLNTKEDEAEFRRNPTGQAA